jgi:hypothetical protein
VHIRFKHVAIGFDLERGVVFFDAIVPVFGNDRIDLLQ